jgi:hypothetical protein
VLRYDSTLEWNGCVGDEACGRTCSASTVVRRLQRRVDVARVEGKKARRILCRKTEQVSMEPRAGDG